MNYCPHCGEKVNSDQDVCLSCGKYLKVEDDLDHLISNDSGGIGYGLLAFFVPLAGLILYFVWKNEKPVTASSLAKGLIAYLIFMVVYVLIIVLILAYAGSLS